MQELCRLCLCNDNLSPIFMDLTRWSNYSAALWQTTGLQIQPYDGMPQRICTECRNNVKNALNLRNISLQTELELLKRGYKKSDDDDRFLNPEATLEVVENPDSSNLYIEPSRTIQLSINRNITKTESINLNNHETNDSFNDNDNDCSNNDGFKDMEIEIECDRLSEDGDTRWPPLDEIKKIPKKTKKEVYLDLVEGDLDAKGPITCKVCKTTLNGWRCFTGHAQIHLGFKFVCEYCGKSFKSYLQLKRHCMSYHGMKRELQCKHCSYLALDNVQLKLHVRRTHTGERPYVCAHCSAAYHSRPCLLQHLETHRTLATVQCEQCPRVFKSNRQLSRHRYAAHAQRARCRHCARCYSHKYLRTHMAKHHADVTESA